MLHKSVRSAASGIVIRLPVAVKMLLWSVVGFDWTLFSFADRGCFVALPGIS